jgi:hypothetical protein
VNEWYAVAVGYLMTAVVWAVYLWWSGRERGT